MVATQVNLSSSSNRDREFADIAVACDGHTLRVHGALDATTVGQFRPVAEGVLQEGWPQLVLDLEGLRLIDSVGVGAIIYVYRQQMGRGARIAVRGAGGQPLAILRLMKLDRLLMGEEELAQLSD